MEDDDPRVARELAGEHDLLDVPARQGGGAGVDTGGADVEALDERARVAVDHLAPDAPAAPVGRLADALEHEVERDGQAGHDPLPQAVVGDVAQTELLALARR